MLRSIAAIGVALSALPDIWRPEINQLPQLPRYLLEEKGLDPGDLARRFTPEQIRLIEKLNRADRSHLGRLALIVLPETWAADELTYSPLPARYSSATQLSKLLVIYVPGQVFAAYEHGAIVRWGPVNTGARNSQTPSGLFALNWKSEGHASSVDPDWYMRWYFNFDSREGLALHQYALPGRPVSHGCIRMLERDAIWLFNWGEEWLTDRQWSRVLQPGTPVLIVGAYDFDEPAPWQSLEWLARVIDLPQFPGFWSLLSRGATTRGLGKFRSTAGNLSFAESDQSLFLDHVGFRRVPAWQEICNGANQGRATCRFEKS